MSKPSEKAMQLARAYLGEKDTTSRWSAIVLLAEMIDAHTAEALEAQHRKTWALAMEEALKVVTDNRNAFGQIEYHGGAPIGGYKEQFACSQIDRDIRALPCPPIQATKDK